MERGHLEKGDEHPPPLRASKFPRRRAGKFRAHFSSDYLSSAKEEPAAATVAAWHRSWRSATRTITVAMRRLRDNNMIIAVTWCGITRGLAGGERSRGPRRRGPMAHGSSLPHSKQEGCGTDRSVSSSRLRISIRCIRRSARSRHPVWRIFYERVNCKFYYKISATKNLYIEKKEKIFRSKCYL
jgi:hypothetical protein